MIADTHYVDNELT